MKIFTLTSSFGCWLLMASLELIFLGVFGRFQGVSDVSRLFYVISFEKKMGNMQNTEVAGPEPPNA